MTRLPRTRFVGIGLLILAAGLAWAVFWRPQPKRSIDLPPVFLWAWERPEDLRFLKGRDVGVAFLAGTITLSGDEANVRPRLQPLLLASGTTLVSVIRIETDRAALPVLSPSQGQRTVQAILDLAGSPQSAMIQLDYDAVVSEREFYRQVLETLRARVPKRKLSMTALTSWCMRDPWIRDLPVDEIVPMLFQMGPDTARVRRALQRRGDFLLEDCRQAVGVSTDESWLPLNTRRRHYVFSPTAWSPRQAERVLQEVDSEP